MSLTLDPEGQLIAGLYALLVPALADLVPSPNFVVGWQDKNLMVNLANTPNSGLVIMNLEGGKPAKIPYAPDSSKNSVGKTITNGTVVELAETLRLDRMLRFVVQCNGTGGRSRRQAIKTRLIQTLGGAYDLPIPDSVESINTASPAATVVDPSLTEYGLTTRLTYVNDLPVDSSDERQEYRYDVLYTATLSYYTATTYPLVTSVNLTEIIRR